MKEYFAKDGRPFTIRKPTADDAAEIISYSKLVFAGYSGKLEAKKVTAKISYIVFW